MFGIHSIARQIRARNFATAAAKTKGAYKPKSFAEIWLSDVGAYPVMSVIAFACLFSTGTGLYFMSTTPDARISKSSRKSIFRGELRSEGYVADQ